MKSFSQVYETKCPATDRICHFPYLNPYFWEGFPDLPASEILDFLKLVRQDYPLEIAIRAEGQTQKEFDIELLKSELLSSLEYLRKNWNAGLKN